MKRSIFALLLFFTIGAKAQSDTVAVPSGTKFIQVGDRVYKISEDKIWEVEPNYQPYIFPGTANKQVIYLGIGVSGFIGFHDNCLYVYANSNQKAEAIKNKLTKKP